MSGRRIDKSKQLNAEDAAIWKRVARTVNAYDKASSALPSAMARDFKVQKQAPRTPISYRSPSSLAPQSPPVKAPYLYSSTKSGLSRYNLDGPQIAKDKKIRRGKISIDRKIDLHDLTQDQAYGALCRAVEAAFSRNQGCLLVVTGKGSLSQRASGGGVLRRNLPLWLGSARLRPMIARYASAHVRHGGSGAYYIFLKGAA